MDSELMQPRHNQITQQHSSSTDEGCETDFGGDLCNLSTVFLTTSSSHLINRMPFNHTDVDTMSNVHRLNSFASSGSSSGVATNFPAKSLSHNLSCDSSRSNFSTFESLDLNLSDCSDFTSSLPSCANVSEAETKEDSKLSNIKYK